MEARGLLTVNGASGDYGSLPGGEQEGPPGSGRRRSHAFAGQPCGVERGTDAEELYIQQAVVLIEDAMQYRSINHRVDARSLRLYRGYYSWICQWGLGLTIAVVLLLAFVERPSSLSISSDPRHRSAPWQPPCGFTESIEMVCLVVFCLDLAVKGYLIGWEEFRKSKWLIAYTVVISFSFIDWMLSVSMACDEKLRVRRLIRPFFLLQNSSMMKKTLKCIKRTLPEIARYQTSLLKCIKQLLVERVRLDVQRGVLWYSLRHVMHRLALCHGTFFNTSSCPVTVMIPAYSLNRAYSIFFVTFSVIGTYCLMNLLTAIIYNQFRGYLLMSVQTSIIRRRLGIRAAFQVLSCQGIQQAAEEHVAVELVLKTMARVQMKSYYREAITKAHKCADVGYMDREQFRKIFDELDKDRIKEHPPLPQYQSPVLQKLQVVFSHYFLTILGNAVALANVICICVSSERDNYIIEIINLCFILYYLFEVCVKIFAFGWKGYLSYRNNIFDGFLTVLLLGLQITIFVTYKLPFSHILSLWEMVRLINMLIVFRFLRIIPDIKLMALVASTLLDLLKNLRAFAGILMVVYYVFAVFGIWLFEGAITPPSEMRYKNITSNFSMECGTYEQLEYWPNNFDDFAAAIMLLYNVMVVNNWQAFLEAYSRHTTDWSKIYFVCWWLTSSVMWVNLFVAVILENFIYKWDRSHSCSVTDVERIRYETSVQLIFREQIQEPTEEELLCQLNLHPHLHLHW
uniref:Ion transport domain-containing protein n=1 Tax=Gasterosteus aculeatus aculeatus TaxID=481459 RepID=A0AAQ4R0D1_GASAC